MTEYKKHDSNVHYSYMLEDWSEYPQIAAEVRKKMEAQGDWPPPGDPNDRSGWDLNRPMVPPPSRNAYIQYVRYHLPKNPGEEGYYTAHSKPAYHTTPGKKPQAKAPPERPANSAQAQPQPTPPPPTSIPVSEPAPGMMSRLGKIATDSVTGLASKTMSLLEKVSAARPQQVTEKDPFEDSVLPAYFYSKFAKQNKPSSQQQFQKPAPPREGLPEGLEYSSVSHIDRADKFARSSLKKKALIPPVPNNDGENYRAYATGMNQRLALLDFAKGFTVKLTPEDAHNFLLPAMRESKLNPKEWEDVSLAELEKNNTVPYIYSQMTQESNDPYPVLPQVAEWDDKYADFFMSLAVYPQALTHMAKEATDMFGKDHEFTKSLRQGTIRSMREARAYAEKALSDNDFAASTNVTREAVNFINSMRETAALRALAGKTSKDTRLHQMYSKDYANALALNFQTMPGRFRKSSSIHPGHPLAGQIPEISKKAFGFTTRPDEMSLAEVSKSNKGYDNYMALMMLESWSQAAMAATDADKYSNIGRQKHALTAKEMDARYQAHFDAYTNASTARKKFAELEFGKALGEKGMEKLNKATSDKIRQFSENLFLALQQEDVMNWERIAAHKKASQDISTATNVSVDLAGASHVLKQYQNQASYEAIGSTDGVFTAYTDSTFHGIYPNPVSDPSEPGEPIPDPRNIVGFMPEFIKLLGAVLDARNQEYIGGIGKQFEHVGLRRGISMTSDVGKSQENVLKGDTEETPMSARLGDLRMHRTAARSATRFKLQTKANSLRF